MALTSAAKFYHDGALKLYFTIAELFVKPYVTDKNLTKLDVEVRSLGKKSVNW